MVPERLSHVGSGFSITELMVILGVAGLIMAIGVPAFLTSWRSATVRGGAQELVSILHAARHLAIKENQTVCVKGSAGGAASGPKLRYLVGSCSASTFCSPTVVTGCVWRDAGTNSDGYLTLANAVDVKAPATDVSFSPLGAASGGTYHVCAPGSTSARGIVTVASSGRIATTYERAGC